MAVSCPTYIVGHTTYTLGILGYSPKYQEAPTTKDIVTSIPASKYLSN